MGTNRDNALLSCKNLNIYDRLQAPINGALVYNHD